MLEKIKSIRKAYSDGNYMAALALSLILPDICGQVEFPSLSGNGNVSKRYKKWFNLHLQQYYENDEIMHTDFIPLDNKKNCVFNADICYALRCAVLHSGNDDVDKVNNAFDFMIYATNMDIDIPISITSLGSTNCSTGEYRQIILLDLYQFCYWISKEAEKSYNQNKSKFEKYVLPIHYVTINKIEDIPNALKSLLNDYGKEKLEFSKTTHIHSTND